jgi:uncharacterized metal-binding protein YceD (DUF177 family)
VTDLVPEFSRILSVARLSPKGVEEYLEAKPAERKALAKRFDIVEVKSLKAFLTLIPKPQEVIDVTGKIEVTIVQNCVVTLEPLVNRMELEINLTFVPEEQNDKGGGEAVIDDLSDEIEVFSGGKIDIGEMVAQQVGVNIDPYPRKPNAVLPVTEFGALSEKKPQPFAKLVDVMKDKKGDV